MAVDDKEQEKPLRRPPPPRPPPVQPIPPPPPPPPPIQYQQPIPPPPPPPGYPMPSATVRTQRTTPPPSPLPLAPQQETQITKRPLKQAEKTQPLPLVGIIIAMVAALMGVITAVFSVFNETLGISLLAISIAGTNAAIIIIAVAIWRLLTRR